MAKVNVSLPEDVLENLDRAARQARTSRSAFLAEAVTHYIVEKEAEQKKRKQKAAAAEMDRLRDKYGGWDGTGEVLKWREKH